MDDLRELSSHALCAFPASLQLKYRPGGRTSTLTLAKTPCRPCTSLPKSWITLALKSRGSSGQASSSSPAPLRRAAGWWPCRGVVAVPRAVLVPSRSAPLSPPQAGPRWCPEVAAAVLPEPRCRGRVPALPPLPAGSARLAGVSQGSSSPAGTVSAAELSPSLVSGGHILAAGRWERGWRVFCLGA